MIKQKTTVSRLSQSQAGNVNYLEIIIDGYNFLKTTGILDTQVSDIELEKGRKRLVQLLVKAFPQEEEREKLTIVFDSQTILNLPTSLNVQGIKIRFSKGYDSADELIMELIRANAVPKRLLIVSSDHEIQTCASRRKASFIDSEKWLDELEKRLADESPSQTGDNQRKSEKPELEDSAYWMQVFGNVTELEDSDWDLEPNSKSNPPTNEQVAIDPSTVDSSTVDSSTVDPNPIDQGSSSVSSDDQIDLDDEDWGDIFPPGYGEDLIE